MSHILIFLIIVALVMVCALLWYAVRTHKSVAQLHAKVDASEAALAAKFEAFKAEATQAAEAAKAKL